HRANGAEALDVLGVRHHLDAEGRAEGLPVTRGRGDVVVAGERPEPAPGVGMLVPGHRQLVAELGERPVHVVAQPEIEAGRIDLVERQPRGRGGNEAHGPWTTPFATLRSRRGWTDASASGSRAL